MPTFSAIVRRGVGVGGYGALKWALRQPERFAAAASLSGALDVARLAGGPPSAGGSAHVRSAVRGPRHQGRARGPYLAGRQQQGPRSSGDQHLLRHRGRTVAGQHQVPRCLCRGRLRIDTSFEAGTHEWAYSDSKFADVLEWLRLSTNPVCKSAHSARISLRLSR